jgi:hypothetical protein
LIAVGFSNNRAKRHDLAVIIKIGNDRQVTAFYVVDCVQGRLMKNLTAQQVITASSLMAGALQAALIQSMIRKNIFTDEEGHEIYEQALLMLETSQALCSSPEVFEAARELIEQHLRKFPFHNDL